MHLYGLDRFPRSIDRGLIEARCPGHRRANPGRDFRDQLIAASLKHTLMATLAIGTCRQVRLSELMPAGPDGQRGLTERQREFLTMMREKKYGLYGGAAGGGKSFMLRWWLLLFLLEIFVRFAMRGVRVGLFCEDYPSLRDRQISKIKHEFPRWLGEVKSTKEEGLGFFLRESFGAGFISLRNLDDPSRYQSTEFAAIGVDELTKNPLDVFEQLRARLRWPAAPENMNFPFAGATNPGGRGHEWVKRFFVINDPPAPLRKQDFGFVRSLASDNPHNPKDYQQHLLTLTDERLRKAYAEGDWDVFEGQFFGEWRAPYHVCRPFRIPAYWRRICASDWGYSKPFASLWLAISPEGRKYVYRELYETRREANWLGAEHKRLSAGETLAYKLLDPACWDASRGISIADQLAKAGWECVPAENDRINGWARVRQALAWQMNERGELAREPELQIFENCPNLIRTLPALPFSRLNPEDVDTEAEDHAPDALRYALMSRPGQTKQPIDLMSREDAETALRLAHEEHPWLA